MDISTRCAQRVKIDAKGRLALPAKLRRELEVLDVSTLVLINSGKCVWAVLPAWMARYEGRLAQADQFSGHAQDFGHLFLAGAQDVELDAAGRLRLHSENLAFAGIERECRLQTLGGRIELWDPARWDEHHAALMARTGGQLAMPPVRE